MREGEVLYACHPCYNNPNKDSTRQFWAKSIFPDSPYKGMISQYEDYGSSLLADAFNLHWKTALNLQLEGKNVTRFAMLHNDIVPEDNWLGILLEELDKTGADLVAAVVPLKDGRGLTSTAIDDPNDEWEVYRRLSLKEINQLPETFTAADFGYPNQHLLVNTGCWICDFTKPWRYRVHFEIKNRMACVVNDGKLIDNTEYKEEKDKLIAFKNQVMSEDWIFSRQLGNLGAKVVATRKVKLLHIGEFPYPSFDDQWGQWEMDKSLQHKFDFDNSIPMIEGWMTEKEGRALARLSKRKAVLEIGSWCGLSTVWIARAASMVTAVDTFDGRGTPTPRNTYLEFKENLKKYKVVDKVSTSVGESKNALPDVEGFFDLVFIDGAHDKESLEEDFKLAKRTIRHEEGSMIAFHDYHSDRFPEVTKFVDSLLEKNRYEVVELVDELIVLKPKASIPDYKRYMV